MVFLLKLEDDEESDHVPGQLSIEKALKKARRQRCINPANDSEYSVCGMSEHQIGERCGAGVQLFFSTLKWYGYLFWAISFIFGWAMYSNGEEGDFYAAVFNSTGQTSYLTKLSYGVQTNHEANRVSQASLHVFASTVIMFFINWLAGRNEKKAILHDEINESAADYALLVKVYDNGSRLLR